MYGEAYTRRLRVEAEARRAQRAAEAAAWGTDPRASLKKRIDEWYRTLPPDARAPSYVMEDLARIFRVPPQQLGLALRAIGWKCVRRWRKGEAYRHYWVPPETDQVQSGEH